MASTSITNKPKTGFQRWYSDLQRSFSIGIGTYIARWVILIGYWYSIHPADVLVLVSPTKNQEEFYKTPPLAIGSF